jgi:hypothetical protein
VRREDVGDGSAAENGGAHRLESERREEEPLTRAQDGRVDEKAVLVDQAGLDQRPGEPYPAVGESENTTLGISFIGLANGPESTGQWAAITA